ncbi:MAG TPA: cytochrome c5 family protein [Gammaproteobacteria bacterium]|nr:cytochrome c5 family protein [Gammaproteobacteria bacterium]
MTQQHHGNAPHDHGSPQGLAPEDAAFFKNFSFLLVALTVIGVVAFILAQFVGYEDTSKSPERVAAAERRTEPFGKVSLAGEEPVTLARTEQPQAVAAAAPPVGGEAVYGAVCAACHTVGVAGAPKTGDAAVWEPRIAQGWDVVAGHAINGYQGAAGMMPARGGRADLTDEAVKQAVGFMLAKANLGSAVPAEFQPGATAPAAEAPAIAEPVADAAGSAAAVDAAPATADAAPEIAAADAAVTVEPTAAEEAPADAAAAAPAAGAATPEQLAQGEAVYAKACAACHGVGVMSAPRLGKAEDWTDRITQDRATIYEHAIKGFVGKKGMMPAKGGRADLSDEDVKNAVEYMLSTVSG